MPKIDNQGQVAVSLYGTSGALTGVNGDTALKATANGLWVARANQIVTLATVVADTTVRTNYALTAVTGLGAHSRYMFTFDMTNADTDAGDTLNVFVDFSPDDGVTWLNAIHFTQVIGTDAAKKEIAILDPTTPGAVVINVTSDAASGVVRPSVFGTQVRVRYTTVDSGTANLSVSFTVKMLAC